MKSRRWHRVTSSFHWAWLLPWLVSVAFSVGAIAKEAQRSFSSPEAAAQALVQAIKAQDRAGTLAVLGSDAGAWISSGDAQADHAEITKFVAAYDAKHEFARNGDKVILTLGGDDFPFAFPLVRSGEYWHFDTEAGKEEMLARRIGENELSTIKVLQAIVDAEIEYASEDRNGDGVLQYAQKFASSPGKQDGLYWPVKPGEQPSPLGELVAEASSEGYHLDNRHRVPYHGYYFRMLKSQGSNAASGPINYVAQGREIGGFAVIAYPARYGNSGVMTFMVNQDGKVYQADLGPDTAVQARKIQRFDPGHGWSLVQTP
jgi:hypothetical protein